MNNNKATPTETIPLWRDPLPVVFLFLWSTGFIGSKLGAPYAEPFIFLGIRFFVAALIMGFLAFIFKAKWPSNPTQILHAIVVGVLVHGCYLGGVFWAIDNGISAGLSALIVSLQPLITGIAVGPLFGERVGIKRWIGLSLGFIGVIMVIGQSLDLSIVESGINLTETAGIIACLIALCGITIGTLYQRHFTSNGDIRTYQSIQLIATAIIMMVLSLSFETGAIEWHPRFITALGWLIFMSVGTFSLLYVLIRRGAASQVAGLFFMVPPITALMAFFLFDEILTGLAMIGMAVTVAGVAIATRK